MLPQKSWRRSVYNLSNLDLTRPYSFFLDSSLYIGSAISANSFVGSRPFLIFKSKGDKVEIVHIDKGRESKECISANPFVKLREIFSKYNNSLPFPLCGGAVGYFGYDLSFLMEEIEFCPKDDLGLPDIYLAFFKGEDIACVENDYIDLLDIEIGKPDIRDIASQLYPNFAKEDYLKAVGKIKDYIRNGEVYQVNLSQRFCLRDGREPFSLYNDLRRFNPVPFGAYLNCGEFYVLSFSPERFIYSDGRFIETRPIKGTRPRAREKREDELLKRELRQSIKDNAEHIMIVDLERNDLGRICAYNTIEVETRAGLESYANVHHLVSVIRGRLRRDISPIDILLSTFPGGSITGAPKIRAMQIIEELEPTHREIYTGALGYIGFNREVNLSIVIRTLVGIDGRLYLQVGGGIVADSQPEQEYQETLDKAASIIGVL